MKPRHIFSLLVLLLGIISCFGCGDDSETVVNEFTFSGKLGGCLVNQQTENLAVIFYGTGNNQRIAIASAYAVTNEGETTYEVHVQGAPPNAIEPTSEEAGVKQYKLTIAAYITDTLDEYGADVTDIQPVGQSSNTIYYFDGTSELVATKGYNYKPGTGGVYITDFEAMEFNFSAEIGCE